MVEVWRGSETFFIKKGKTGCLLLHGGTGTPAVVRPMGEFLARNGISALGVRLRGYATSVEEWLKTDHSDWVASAEEALHDLERDCKSVFVSGLSMGGSLALYLASKHQTRIAGVIPICAPAGPSFLNGFREKFAPLAEDNIPQPNYSATDIREKNVTPGGYDCHYPSLNLEWAKLVEKTNRGLHAIQCPALIVQAENDHVVDPKTAEWIYANIGSKRKEILWLKNSYHMATIDVDREQVYREAVDFISSVTG